MTAKQVDTAIAARIVNVVIRTCIGSLRSEAAFDIGFLQVLEKLDAGFSRDGSNAPSAVAKRKAWSYPYVAVNTLDSDCSQSAKRGGATTLCGSMGF
jgi:hypothetical protein